MRDFLFRLFWRGQVFADMLRARERCVVLGCGWGGFRILKDVALGEERSLTCVSKNNYFVFTPLLTTTTVGTLEFRNVCEPTMFARDPRFFQFFHAEAIGIDTANKKVLCQSVYDAATGDGDKREHPRFEVPYDKLVIAVGARAATYGIPGVKEYTFPLRTLSDARLIRQRLVEVFERAASPFCTEEEKQRLLHFVIVGGGPTSVEFAAELHDFLAQDVTRLFPTLRKYCRVTLIEAGPRVLGSFSANLSEYTMKLFETRAVELLMARTVTRVHPHHMQLSDGTQVHFGLCVWSTGNEQLPFVKSLPFEKDRTGRLIVDEYLKVDSPCKSIWAIGDCSAERPQPRPATAQVAQQEGKYVARVWSGKTTEPFRYQYKGMLAYVGGARALVDLPIVRTSGIAGWIFWNSAYITTMVSWRNKIFIPLAWLKSFLWGRDVLSFPTSASWLEPKSGGSTTISTSPTQQNAKDDQTQSQTTKRQ